MYHRLSFKQKQNGQQLCEGQTTSDSRDGISVELSFFVVQSYYSEWRKLLTSCSLQRQHFSADYCLTYSFCCTCCLNLNGLMLSKPLCLLEISVNQRGGRELKLCLSTRIEKLSLRESFSEQWFSFNLSHVYI